MVPHDGVHSSATGEILGDGARAESSERYASMFTHHPHAAYSVDTRGYFTDANDRSLEMTGLSLEEMRRTHFAQVIHPDDLHLIQDGFDRAMAGDPQVVEARVVRVDGEVVDIRCTAIPVIVADEVVGVHGVTEDVTEAKRVLRELEEANAAKTLFLATVSHEVRTPLAALVGASELLIDTDLPPEPEHFARIVHRSGERLMHLVQEILEFSGLEARQTVLRRAPVDVRAIIGDARRITQVVTNLVQNAIAYTEHGSVDVRVSGRPCSADGPGVGSWVDFRVRDTGIGIAHDDLRTLFDPFVQADPQSAGDRLGVGLGLAICRELVDLMSGHLGVESTLGEGSTFTFGLPLPPA